MIAEYRDLTFLELINVFWKRAWLILSIVIISMTTSGVVSYYVLTPQYKASAEIIVNQGKRDGYIVYTLGDIQVNLELVDTYSVIIKSPRILDLVIDEYQLDMTYEQLSKKISVNAIKNSQVISINVIDYSHEQAVLIANAIVKTFQHEIIDIMSVDNVQILAEAKQVATPIQMKPKPLLNMGIALVVGLLTGMLLAMLLAYLDKTLRTEQDIERSLGLPVLGTINLNEFSQKQRTRRSVVDDSVGGENIEA